MIKFNGGIRACGIILLWATAAIALPAQTTAIAPHGPALTTLFSFDNMDGSGPFAALVQATNGDLYGTTESGSNGDGTVFKITLSGTFTTLQSFDDTATDGASLYAALIQAANGNFYGTTYGGGANNAGTVFKITANGTLTSLHSFDITDGRFPIAGLVQGTDGEFYGTTASGGANNAGTVFKITSSGMLTTLYNFCSQGGSSCTDGFQPEGTLIQASDGNFYGTTNEGGNTGTGDGTVFRITSSGALTTLHSFAGSDGAYPRAALIQANNGILYGTTYGGGVDDLGTVFQITLDGTLTPLHSFDLTDGADINAGLMQATDGNLYGTATRGGANDNAGTAFKITTGGALTTLYNFCRQSNCTDGAIPEAPMVQDTNGKFYGTTVEGGALNFGSVFSLSSGLGPFVKTQPTSGAVGAAVKILGTNLTGATSVTFNGTAATFTVKSKSEITTTVPTGATTGTVQVVTPSATLSSNVPFTVN
jgi:uncharacterized repeat protein (TIGR03803 family)